MAERRRRSAVVMLSIMPLLATGLSGCGSDDEPDNVAICVDPRTEQRLPDKECGDENGHGGGGGLSPFAWYYLGGLNSGRTYQAPAVGQRVAGGTFTRPASGRIAYSGRTTGFSVPKSGGAVSRGGFGGGGSFGGRSGG